MRTPPPTAVRLYWVVTLALLAGAVAMALFYAPVEATMGPVQKIFYLHLPVAMNAFLAAFIVFIGSTGYIWTRQQYWDDLALAAARIAVLCCTAVLITGMIWARSAWGAWWTWSPRLTFSLLLWLLYVVYLVVRPSFPSPQRRALISAVYGAVAFLDVPLVYLSVRFLPDIHPASVTLEPEMRLTLVAWFPPVTMLCMGLIATLWLRARRGVAPGVGVAVPDPGVRAVAGRPVHAGEPVRHA